MLLPCFPGARTQCGQATLRPEVVIPAWPGDSSQPSLRRYQEIMLQRCCGSDSSARMVMSEQDPVRDVYRGPGLACGSRTQAARVGLNGQFGVSSEAVGTGAKGSAALHGSRTRLVAVAQASWRTPLRMNPEIDSLPGDAECNRGEDAPRSRGHSNAKIYNLVGACLPGTRWRSSST